MNFTKLENLIEHDFADRKLLQRALTHRSWANENARERAGHNELLEFLGDSVLGLVIAEELLRSHPDLDEGGLTLMKHDLVSTATLAEISLSLGLGSFLRLGKGEERSGGRNKPALLANALEAVIGAVFYDDGYEGAQKWLKKIFAERLDSVTPAGSNDNKTRLQEVLQARKFDAPVYRVIYTSGMPHEREFHVEAQWAGGTTTGSGRSIKSAEMAAAGKALEILNSSDIVSSSDSKNV